MVTLLCYSSVIFQKGTLFYAVSKKGRGNHRRKHEGCSTENDFEKELQN